MTPNQYRSLDQVTVYNVITKKNLICLASEILTQKAQQLLVWNNALPQTGKPPHNRRLSPVTSCTKL
jgi:hypothetical protein